MSWLSKEGPFWDDERTHDPGTWLQLRDGTLVTDTATGEAGWRVQQGETAELVSFTPSKWEYTPVEVFCHQEQETALWKCDVANHHQLDTVQASLLRRRPPMRTWEDFRQCALSDSPHLVFGEDAFDELFPLPFSAGPARLPLANISVL